MSWAALRETTGEEDRAYSLMGLFGVNMPLLYGEGGTKAFARLQQEITRQSSDDSIFAWTTAGNDSSAKNYCGGDATRKDLFAWRPDLFCSAFGVHTAWNADRLSALSPEQWMPATLRHTSTTYEESQHFLSLTAPILTLEDLRGASKVTVFAYNNYSPCHELTRTSLQVTLEESRAIAILSCCSESGRVGILLHQNEDGTYSRIVNESIFGVQFSELPRRYIRIRHREGLGVECHSGAYPCIDQLDVILCNRV